MSGAWDPEFWNSLGVVGVVVIVAVAFVVSLTRGWLIPGRYHREIVDGKTAENTKLRERAAIDAETMKIQAQTISQRDTVEDTATKLLQAFRDAASGGGGH